MRLDGLAPKLRAYRKSLGLTQRELGSKAGIAQEFISEIEKGKKRPSIEVLEKLCGALGCSADYLLGLSGGGYCRIEDEKPPTALSRQILQEIIDRQLTEKDLMLALKVAEVMHQYCHEA